MSFDGSNGLIAIAKLRTDIRGRSVEYKQMKLKQASQADDLLKLLTDNSDLKSQLKQRENDAADMKKRYDIELLQMKHQLDDAISEKEAECSRLRSDSDSKMSTITEAQQTISKLQIQLYHLEKQQNASSSVDSLQQPSQADGTQLLHERVSTFSGVLQMVENRIKGLEDDAIDAHNFVRRSKTHMESISNQIDSLTEENTKLKNYVKELLGLISNHAGEVQLLRNSKSTLEEELSLQVLKIKDDTTTIESLREQNSNLMREIEKQRQQGANNATELISSCAQLESTIEARRLAEDTIIKLNLRVVELEDELEAYRKKLEPNLVDVGIQASCQMRNATSSCEIKCEPTNCIKSHSPPAQPEETTEIVLSSNLVSEQREFGDIAQTNNQLAIEDKPCCAIPMLKEERLIVASQACHESLATQQNVPHSNGLEIFDELL